MVFLLLFPCLRSFIRYTRVLALTILLRWFPLILTYVVLIDGALGSPLETLFVFGLIMVMSGEVEFIAGGGGIVLLEELEHAKARGAKIYCELEKCPIFVSSFENLNDSLI